MDLQQYFDIQFNNGPNTISDPVSRYNPGLFFILPALYGSYMISQKVVFSKVNFVPHFRNRKVQEVTSGERGVKVLEVVMDHNIYEPGVRKIIQSTTNILSVDDMGKKTRLVMFVMKNKDLCSFIYGAANGDVATTGNINIKEVVYEFWQHAKFHNEKMMPHTLIVTNMLYPRQKRYTISKMLEAIASKRDVHIIRDILKNTPCLLRKINKNEYRVSLSEEEEEKLLHKIVHKYKTIRNEDIYF